MEEESKDLTKAGRFRALKEIVDQLKDLKKNKDIHFCHKGREVDGVLLGAARAIFYKLKPHQTDYNKNKKNYSGFITVDELGDKDDLYFILRVMGYYHNLINADNPEKQKKCHDIIYNLAECRRIAENYFESNYLLETEKGFKKLITQERPDTTMYEELRDSIKTVESETLK